MIICLFAGIIMYGCAKSGIKPVTPHSPAGTKTAPDNYSKTVTEPAASLFALWKPISGYTTFYDVNGVLLTTSKFDASALNRVQFFDATHVKETFASGDTLRGAYTLTTKDSTLFINFISDEGLNSYGIDTLTANRLAMSQILKFANGTTLSINGVSYTVYEYVTHFNFNQ